MDQTPEQMRELIEAELMAAMKHAPRAKGLRLSSISVRASSRNSSRNGQASWCIERTLNLDAGGGAEGPAGSSPVISGRLPV